MTAFAGIAQPGSTVRGWRVDSIRETVARLESAGVVFVRCEGLEQHRSGVWTTPNGDQVAWFTDPYGNVLSLTQFQ